MNTRTPLFPPLALSFWPRTTSSALGVRTPPSCGLCTLQGHPFVLTCGRSQRGFSRSLTVSAPARMMGLKGVGVARQRPSLVLWGNRTEKSPALRYHLFLITRSDKRSEIPFSSSVRSRIDAALVAAVGACPQGWAADRRSPPSGETESAATGAEALAGGMQIV